MIFRNIINQLAELQGSNFEVGDVQVFKDRVEWRIIHKEEAFYICPRCGEIHESYYDSSWITLRDVHLGVKKGFWKVKRVRILCTCSSSPLVEYLPFKSPRHRLTMRLLHQIEELLCSKMITVADAARIFELSYMTVYKIDHEVLYRLVQKLHIPYPEHICVDEKSFKKGHRYVTIIIDCDLRKVIWVSEGNRKESLDQFFEILGPEGCKKIKTVAKDLHKPYALSCRDYIPHAVEIADKFHVVQRLNKAMDECRRELSVGSKLQVSKRKTIHNMQWILRYKSSHLKPNQVESLETLEEVNKPLYQAYLHKEKFYELFEFTPDQEEEAKVFLVRWIVDAFKIGLKGIKSFAEYINNNQKIIINIIKERRTSALSEGINRKVTVLKSMAYGYHNVQYFMLKILQRCGVLGAMYQPLITH